MKQIDWNEPKISLAELMAHQVTMLILGAIIALLAHK